MDTLFNGNIDWDRVLNRAINDDGEHKYTNCKPAGHDGDLEEPDKPRPVRPPTLWEYIEPAKAADKLKPQVEAESFEHGIER